MVPTSRRGADCAEYDSFHFRNSTHTPHVCSVYQVLILEQRPLKVGIPRPVRRKIPNRMMQSGARLGTKCLR